MSQKSERMLVISFDLCRYSEITAVQTATAGGEQNPVVSTNAAIHKAIIEPLKAFARANPGLRYYIKSTGDGALVFFPADKASVAIDYIVNFQSRAEKRNRKYIRDKEEYGLNPKDDRLFRFFRIGCAVGRISIYVVSKHSGADFAGLAIADSVRIESTGRAGETLISEEVYSLLDNTRQMEFGRKRRVVGKHSSERYMVRSIPPGLTAPWEIRTARTNSLNTVWKWSVYALIPLLTYGFKTPIANFLLALP
jgi:class 3 adenylate cyclase